jgi:predicted O-methyltransferase YrrM
VALLTSGTNVADSAVARDYADRIASETFIPAARLLAQVYATGSVEAADGTNVRAFPTSLPPEHANELIRLVRDMRFTRTIETGMAYGISTLAIGSVHQERGEGSHIAIDPIQAEQYGSIGTLNLRRAGLEDRVRVIEERADVALPRLRDEGLRLDFGFIDGRHLFDYALLDFFYIDQMLDVGGVVVFHDTWKPGVAEAAAFVSANRAYEPLPAADHGLTVMRKLADDDRKGWFHRNFERGARRPTLRYALRALPSRVTRRFL